MVHTKAYNIHTDIIRDQQLHYKLYAPSAKKNIFVQLRITLRSCLQLLAPNLSAVRPNVYSVLAQPLFYHP